MSNSTRRKRQPKDSEPPSTVKRSRHSPPDDWIKRPNCSVLHLGTKSAAACPSLTLPANMSTAALDSDTSLLAASLYPLPVDEFKRDYWRQRAVAIVGAGSGRVQELIAVELHELDVKEMMADSASEQIFVWMKERHNTPSASSSASSSSSSLSALANQPITSFPLDNPNQLDAALACYNSGSSLYFRSPPALAHRFVRAFNAGVGFNFAGLDYSSVSSSSQPKGEIEVFVSRAGHHTGYHVDFMDNFTIQLRGTKTWSFREVDIRYPVRGFTPHYKDRSTDELQYKVHSACRDKPYMGAPPVDDERVTRVTLSAGDVLYHPAGIWHAVSCDEDSISINISLIATAAADLISDAVRQLLWRTEAGRAGLCGTVSDMHKQLEQALASLKRSVLDNTLSEDAILPAAMMAPRQRRPVYFDSSVDKRMLTNKQGRACDLSEVFSVDERYSFNPLMTITMYRGSEESESEDEDEYEDGDEAAQSELEDSQGAVDELDEQKEVQEVEVRDHGKRWRSNDDNVEQRSLGDRRQPSETYDGEGEIHYAQYVLHHLFGNESVDSAMRTVLRVHHSLQAAFDHLVTPRDAFAVENLLLSLKGCGSVIVQTTSKFGTVAVHTDERLLDSARCLFVLRELGFVTPTAAPPHDGIRVRTADGTYGVVIRNDDGSLQLRLVEAEGRTMPITRREVDELLDSHLTKEDAEIARLSR